VSDAAQRETHVLDRTALGFKRRCNAHQSKRVARAVANLPVPGVPCESQWRQVNRGDQFIRIQAGLDLRRVSRQTVKIIYRNAASAVITLNLYRCIEGRECDAHIRWMGGNAAFGSPQNGMDSVKPADRIATRPWRPFIATGSFVVKVIAPGALHQVAPGGRHISNLTGCAERLGCPR
jgi:hypothetical protein